MFLCVRLMPDIRNLGKSQSADCIRMRVLRSINQIEDISGNQNHFFVANLYVIKVRLESRKFQEINMFFFVAHLHIILHLYTIFQVNPTNCFTILMHTRMVKIFRIKLTKRCQESRKFQEIKNLFFRCTSSYYSPSMYQISCKSREPFQSSGGHKNG